MARIIRLPGGVRFDYDALSGVERAEVDEQLAAFAELVERNPLQGFDPFPKQREFLASRTKVKLAIAGNRAGKTEIGVAYDLIQCVDLECLPSWLKPYKFFEVPQVRIVTMDLGATLYGVMIPKVQKLVPKDQLLGGSWAVAFEKTLRILRFKNGSTIQFMSAEMDVPKFAGATLDLVHFDEEPPPPNGYDIYRENRMRLIDRSGQMIFTMTPAQGIRWTYDELYERRHEPGVGVTEWSMLDNPYLPPDEVAAEIADIKSEKERQARIEGKFVFFRGLVLEEFDDDHHVVKAPARKHVQALDVLVGIDPGIAQGGVVWVGFDRDNHALVFDELYPGSMTVDQIVAAITLKNRLWGIRPDFYVIDPSARNRSLTNAESVEGAFLRRGIPTVHGQNDRVAGIMEMKARLENRALLVAENCEHWLFERLRWRVAEDETTGKGVNFTTLGPDHLMDPTRYVLMERLYAQQPITDSPTSRGYRKTYDPDFEEAWTPSRPVPESSPMGMFA